MQRIGNVRCKALWEDTVRVCRREFLHQLAASVAALATFAMAGATVSLAQGAPSGTYAELPGVKLWFIDTGGTGTPIVLLHANTGTSAIWQHQITSFAQA